MTGTIPRGYGPNELAMSDGFQNFNKTSMQSPMTKFEGTTNYTQVS